MNIPKFRVCEKCKRTYPEHRTACQICGLAWHMRLVDWGNGSDPQPEKLEEEVKTAEPTGKYKEYFNNAITGWIQQIQLDPVKVKAEGKVRYLKAVGGVR